MAAALAQVARLAADATEQARPTRDGAALLPAGGDEVPAEEAKSALIAARTAAAATARELTAATQAARAELDRRRRALDAELAELAASLAPLQDHVRRLGEGIQAINLYLGVGEGLVALTDGTPAPAGTPIHVRQQVLAMDEECAVAADSGGIDHRRIEDFDAWVTADPAHRDQLIPESRGVVAIMPRRAEADYGDPLTSAMHNARNHQTYLLVRNGEILYRYLADGFNVGSRLVPRRDEFTALFTTTHRDLLTSEVRTVALEPGTPAWERAERAAGARERHFMRVALILQGLIDRTAVFHPLPAVGVSVLRQRAYDDGHIVLVADDEHVLTTGRPAFHEWLRDRTAQLRPGMRIVGHFDSQAWRDVNECWDRGTDRQSSWRHSRLHPPAAPPPRTGEVYTLLRRGGAFLVFAYARTDEVWRSDVPVPDRPGYVYTGRHAAEPRRRATARVHPSDRFVIPFDLVTVEECEWYLRSRTDRHAYVTMLPVLHAVIAAKRAEAAAEAPMRRLLVGAIAAEHHVDVDEADAAVPALVDWWKLTNRWHRPLVAGGSPDAERRAVIAIGREFAARRAARAADDAATGEQVGALRAQVPAAMVVARKRDGSWIVLEPQPRTLPGEPTTVWVREHTWTPTLRGHRTRDWVLPEPAQLGRWQILWTGPAWNGWDTAATAADHLTDPELIALVAEAVDAAARLAAAPHRPYRTAAPQPPLGGRAVAVDHQRRDGRDPARRLVVHWRCDPSRIDPGGSTTADGVDAAELTLTWRRTTGRRLHTDHGGLRRRHWTGAPAPDRGGVRVWADPDAVEALEGELAAHRAAVEVRAQIDRRAHTLLRDIGRQWSDAAREAARCKFVADYGDESLWADHSAGLRFACPHLDPRPVAPWRRAVEHLLTAGEDPGGLTVAAMAARYTIRTGDTVDVPPDLAPLVFPPQKHPDGCR